MKTAKVVRNIWGNYGCFIGTSKAIDFGREWDATSWLADILESGEYKLSSKSDITQKDVNTFLDKVK